MKLFNSVYWYNFCLVIYFYWISFYPMISSTWLFIWGNKITTVFLGRLHTCIYRVKLYLTVYGLCTSSPMWLVENTWCENLQLFHCFKMLFGTNEITFWWFNLCIIKINKYSKIREKKKLWIANNEIDV